MPYVFITPPTRIYTDILIPLFNDLKLLVVLVAAVVNKTMPLILTKMTTGIINIAEKPMTTHRVKGYLKGFAQKLAKCLKEEDYIAATHAIMDLATSNNGKRVLKWMAAAFCRPGGADNWPDIDGDIHDELSDSSDILHDNREFIGKITIHALIKAAR